MNRHFNLEAPNRGESTKIILGTSYIILVIDIVQNVAFVPLFISSFGTRLYGIWLATGGVVGMLSFFDLGIPSLMIQRTAREYAKKNFEGISEYFMSGIFLHTVLMLLLMITALIIGNYLPMIVPMEADELAIVKKAYTISVIAMCFALVNNGIEGIANALQKPIIVKTSMIIGSILGLLTIFIGVNQGLSIVAIPLGFLVRAVFPFFVNITFLLVLFVKNNIPLKRLDKSIINDYLDFIPSIFMSKLGTAVSASIQPTLIARFILPEVAVYYSITVKIASLLRSILDRIGGSLFPSFAHLHGEGKVAQVKNVYLSMSSKVLFAGFILYSFYVMFNEAFIHFWVGSENFLENPMSLMIAFAILLAFFSNFNSYLLGSTGDIKFPSRLVFIESWVSIVSLYLGLKYIGVYAIPTTSILVGATFMFIYIVRWRKNLSISAVELSSYYKPFLFPFCAWLTVVSIFFLLGINHLEGLLYQGVALISMLFLGSVLMVYSFAEVRVKVINFFK